MAGTTVTDVAFQAGAVTVVAYGTKMVTGVVSQVGASVGMVQAELVFQSLRVLDGTGTLLLCAVGALAAVATMRVLVWVWKGRPMGTLLQKQQPRPLTGQGPLAAIPTTTALEVRRGDRSPNARARAIFSRELGPPLALRVPVRALEAPVQGRVLDQVIAEARRKRLREFAAAGPQSSSFSSEGVVKIYTDEERRQQRAQRSLGTSQGLVLPRPTLVTRRTQTAAVILKEQAVSAVGPTLRDAESQWVEEDWQKTQGRRLRLRHAYAGSSMPGLGPEPTTEEEVAERRHAMLSLPPAGPGDGDRPWGPMPGLGAVVGFLDASHTLFVSTGILNEAGPGTRVRLAGFTFDLQELSDVLIVARKRGVLVQVLFDKKEASQGGSAVDQFQHMRALEVNGVELRVVSGQTLAPLYRGAAARLFGRQHAKAVWSEQRAFMGSANWTRASTRNCELGVEIKLNASGRAQLAQWWDSYWDRAVLLDGRSPWEGAASSSVNPGVSGNGGRSQSSFEQRGGQPYSRTQLGSCGEGGALPRSASAP